MAEYHIEIDPLEVVLVDAIVSLPPIRWPVESLLFFPLSLVHFNDFSVSPGARDACLISA